MPYAELHCLSHYSFLRGASHPEELIERAAACGYSALAITDECSLAGIVKAHVAAKEHGIQLIVGSEFLTTEGVKLVALAPTREAYAELSGLISRSRRRSEKGSYCTHLRDVIFHLKRCFIIWLPQDDQEQIAYGLQLARLCPNRLWLGISRLLGNNEYRRFRQHYQLAKELAIPMVACGNVHMHCAQRKPLQDVLTAIKYRTTIQQLGTRRLINSQQHLRRLDKIHSLYPPPLITETLTIASQCQFSLDELRYEYPEEVVPDGYTPSDYLREQVWLGAEKRWPKGVPQKIHDQIEYELALIQELRYEPYFLTVYDIVNFARSRNILCQGRGSAANSVVCYCLFITEVSPEHISLLFERFISRERDEPPDIDVDFEHERREEVIQYIYQKYSRRRAALAATVITYRSRSAIRDVGKALGMANTAIQELSQSLAWWNRERELQAFFSRQGGLTSDINAAHFLYLVQQIIGFPRHLSQHVGGFIISRGPLSRLVPIENASMPERTIIQWDKQDIEALGLLKVDILALGMLSAIRKSLDIIKRYDPRISTIQDIPKEDKATYTMLQKADSIGVFQIESRAQMTMLPRLKPACFYDLVIEIAIVRPGPIQGQMVHPYLRRRNGEDAITYPNDQIKDVLKSTLGVPIFQEQVIRLAMVAAGFSGGEADALRRAITNWGKDSKLLRFEDKLKQGMQRNGYREEYIDELFEQIKGFGGYGFPESHSASFALLAYISAWLKRHHTAAFYIGLLNSQPMGFYSPSQLLQDAKRHGVSVLSIDINQSDWDHKLVTSSPRPSIRLGLRIIKGLEKQAALRIMDARRHGLFRHIHDLQNRAQLHKNDLQCLASADALFSLSGHRYQAQWENMAIEPYRPLLGEEQHSPVSLTKPDVPLVAPTLADDVLEDYRATGLSLKQHPLALLRQQQPFSECKKYSELGNISSKRFVQVAGLVTCRQRPGTASGVIFLTLEDETGNHNVVVWPTIQERFRSALLKGQLLRVKGVLEKKEGVMHVIASALFDHTDQLTGLSLPSRQFR